MAKKVKLEDIRKKHDEMESADIYKVQVYVAHGFYEYEVSTVEQATAHVQAITNSGVYRRAIPGGMEAHKPYKVKAIGPGLESQYKDKFVRT